MLYWPRRSPFNASKWLLLGVVRSNSCVAASSRSSALTAALNGTPWSRRTCSPFANRSVSRSRCFGSTGRPFVARPHKRTAPLRLASADGCSSADYNAIRIAYQQTHIKKSRRGTARTLTHVQIMVESLISSLRTWRHYGIVKQSTLLAHPGRSADCCDSHSA